MDIISTPKDFKEAVATNKGWMIVDFFATWCVPCGRMDTTLESIDRCKDVNTIIKVDVEENYEVAATHKITSMPTLVLYHKQQAVARWEGGQDLVDVLEWLHEHQGLS